MNTEIKRRAVFTVMSDLLNGSDLWKVMWHWQNHYADKPSFELNRFLSDCHQLVSFKENRSDIYRHLIGMQMRPQEELKDDPWAEMKVFSDENYQSGTASGWGSVMVHVFCAMMNHLRADTQRSLQRYVISQADRAGLPVQLTLSYQSWFQGFSEGEGTAQKLDTGLCSHHDLRAFLNLHYIGLCELVGPVSADKMLSASVQKAHFLNQSGQTDPRTLL